MQIFDRCNFHDFVVNWSFVNFHPWNFIGYKFWISLHQLESKIHTNGYIWHLQTMMDLWILSVAELESGCCFIALIYLGNFEMQTSWLNATWSNVWYPYLCHVSNTLVKNTNKIHENLMGYYPILKILDLRHPQNLHSLKKTIRTQ